MANDQSLSETRQTGLGSQTSSAHPMDSARCVTALDHIVAELEKIRPLLARHFRHTRARAGTDEGLKGLVVSEREVEDLLSRPIGEFAAPHSDCDRNSEPSHSASNQDSVCLRANGAETDYSEMRLRTVARLFGLTPFDVMSLLIPLSVELDPRFGQLFAYLQDDVTTHQPSIDLILRLVCD